MGGIPGDDGINGGLDWFRDVLIVIFGGGGDEINWFSEIIVSSLSISLSNNDFP
jgi:hypothetical protein